MDTVVQSEIVTVIETGEASCEEEEEMEVEEPVLETTTPAITNSIQVSTYGCTRYLLILRPDIRFSKSRIWISDSSWIG